MENYIEFKEYVRKFAENKECVENLTSYFESKADVLEGILKGYTKGYDRVSDAIECDKGSAQSIKEESISKSDAINDEIMIALFKEYLKDNYYPPFGNLNGIRLHLMGLWIFYRVIKPEKFDILSLLQMDIATLKLVSIASPVAVGLGPLSKSITRTTNVKKAKKTQFKKSSDDVFDAYQELGASYNQQNGKKPFSYDDKQYSWNGFALELRDLQAIRLTPPQIIKHLKYLIENESI